MKYTEDHAWLDADGDLITVGITEYGVEELGEIVFVELPEIETQVTKGDEIAVIESAGMNVDLLAPLDGEIVEVNEILSSKPHLVNEDPTGDAWFFKIQVEDAGELEIYMTEDEYRDFIGV